MPLTHNHDGVSTLIHTVHIDPNMKMWCAGDRLCGAIARNEHEHTTVEQMPTIAAMRVSIFTIIIIYFLDSIHEFVFCFLLFSVEKLHHDHIIQNTRWGSRKIFGSLPMTVGDSFSS
jgi:hypothetical protein